jgi:hypothetical protein
VTERPEPEPSANDVVGAAGAGTPGPGTPGPGTPGAGDDVGHDLAHDPDVVDELPEDLQPALAVGPYVFPNNSRRRIPGVMYLVVAVGLAALWAAVRDSDVVNGGFLAAAVLLAVFGVYSLVVGRDLAVDERDALVLATADLGIVVGHASAQLGWRGVWSRPTWRLLMYSAEEPPRTRALVFVDGIDGSIVERIVEDNPEDWTELVSRPGS